MNEIINNNKNTYDALAEQYEKKVNQRKEFNKTAISQFIHYISNGNKILDLGCAVGLDASIFIENGFSVVGLELSEEMVKFARKRNPSAKILSGNFLEANFDERFDGIYAQAFVHLFPKEEAITVIKKIKSLLNKEGVAHITSSKSDESKEGWFVKSDYSGEHKRFRKYWTKEEMEETLKQVGFVIVDYYEIKDPYEKEWMVFTAKNSPLQPNLIKLGLETVDCEEEFK